LPVEADGSASRPRLQAWLDGARTTSGPIFRRVLRGGHVGQLRSGAALPTTWTRVFWIFTADNGEDGCCSEGNA
jgi:hypothetical protein